MFDRLIRFLDRERQVRTLRDQLHSKTFQFDGAIRELDDIEQALGRALGYPPYGPDRVCVGDHVAVTLAREAAGRLGALESAAKGSGECASRVLCQLCDALKRIEELKDEIQLMRDPAWADDPGPAGGPFR